MAYDVVGIGLSCHDNIAIIPEMPTFESRVRVIESSEQGGGPAATAITAASRLGLSSTFLARVGDDNSGKFIIDDFEKYGVDTNNIIIQAGGKSHKVVVLVEQSTGDRAFITESSTVTPLTPSDITPDILHSTSILHLDDTNPEVNLFAAREARKANTLVIMDATHPQNINKEILKYVDIFIPSRFFYKDFTGYDNPFDGAKALLEYGLAEVIITLGEDGAVCANNKELVQVPAFAVDDVVDTTGCGDVFHGGYIFSRLQNWDMRSSVQFASAVAALKSKKIGGRKGIPSLEETLTFLKARLSDDWSHISLKSLYTRNSTGLR